MKKLIASVLFSCVWVGPALADSPKAQSKDPPMQSSKSSRVWGKQGWPAISASLTPG